MSEGRSSVSVRGQNIDDGVVLFVGGKIFSGWTSAQITRKLNSIASSFSLELTDRWTPEQEPVGIARGQKFHLHIGGTTVMDGYIDEVNSSIDANNRTLSVSGRSKSADLVDCSYVGPSQFKETTMETVVNSMVEPFGVKAIFRSPGGDLPKVDIRQGEKVAEVIERLAREKNLIVYSSFNGNLVFDVNSSSRSVSEIIQGRNMLSGSVNRNNSNRYSEYIVKGQSGGVVGSPENATKNTGTAKDSGVSRYRPLLMLAENSANTSSAGKRASYEASVRAAKSETFSVSVQGWFQREGTLWDINKVTGLRSSYLDHNGDLLIDSVVFSKSNSGTVTKLTLIRPDAYQFDPTVKKSDSDKSGGLVGG